MLQHALHELTASRCPVPQDDRILLLIRKLPVSQNRLLKGVLRSDLLSGLRSGLQLAPERVLTLAP